MDLLATALSTSRGSLDGTNGVIRGITNAYLLKPGKLGFYGSEEVKVSLF